MKGKTNKTSKVNEINKRYALVLDTLDRLERGMYTGGLDVYWCGNSITWLWKFRKITAEEKDALCDRVIALCKGGF